MVEREQYRLLLLHYKAECVKTQSYEIACSLRDIERTHFLSEFEDYTGFDKERFMKEIEGMTKRLPSTLWILRDFKLKLLLP
jgi:hypothetical protein